MATTEVLVLWMGQLGSLVIEYALSAPCPGLYTGRLDLSIREL